LHQCCLCSIGWAHLGLGPFRSLPDRQFCRVWVVCFGSRKKNFALFHLVLSPSPLPFGGNCNFDLLVFLIQNSPYPCYSANALGSPLHSSNLEGCNKRGPRSGLAGLQLQDSRPLNPLDRHHPIIDPTRLESLQYDAWYILIVVRGVQLPPADYRHHIFFPLQLGIDAQHRNRLNGLVV
jgi:hypothetical protein